MKSNVLIRKVFLLTVFICGSLGYADAQINTPMPEIPFGTNDSYEHGTMPTNANHQDAEDAYNQWKSDFVRTCGDGYMWVQAGGGAAAGADAVSEGIAYGMLLAAYAGDKELFDGLWKFYDANKTVCTGVMNWSIRVNDNCTFEPYTETQGSPYSGAADAEVDAAMALIIADRQWPDATDPYDYRAEAEELINNIMDWVIDHQTADGRYELSNGDGWLGYDPSNCGSNFARQEDDYCRNPSYQAPGYFECYVGYLQSNQDWQGNDDPWSEAINAGRDLWINNAHPTTGLASNWSNPGGSLEGSCSASGTPPNAFGYDAIRAPWRQGVDVMWNGGTPQLMNVIENQAGFWQSNDIHDAYNWDGTNNPENGGAANNSVFYGMIAAQSTALGEEYQSYIDNMYALNRDVTQETNYFNRTLRAMGLFVQTGNFWSPCANIEPCLLPTPDLGSDIVLCDDGGTVDVLLDPDLTEGDWTYTWTRNGEEVGSGDTYIATAEGDYEVTIANETCERSGNMSIVLLEAGGLTADGDVICSPGEEATLAVTEGNGPFSWFTQPEGGDPVHTGTTFSPENIEESTTFYVTNTTTSGIFTMGPEEPGDGEVWDTKSDPDYDPSSMSDEDLKVEIVVEHSALILESFTVYPSGGGLRRVVLELVDSEGEVLFEFDDELSGGEQTIQTNQYLPPGTYYLQPTTDNEGPFRQKADGEPKFPFEEEGIVTLPAYPSWKIGEDDDLNSLSWSMFYNITFNAAECARIPVQVELDPESEECACEEPADIAITQGTDVNVCEGESIDLTIDEEPNLSTFELVWYSGDYPDGDFEELVGENTGTLGVDYADAGIYTVAVRDAEQPGATECIKTAQIEVSQVDVVAEINPVDQLEYCEGDGGVDLQATNAGAGATYEWSDGTPGDLLEGATQGTYTVTVTLDGCEAISDEVNVSVLALPVAEVLTSGTDLEYETGEGGVTLEAATETGATYAWTGPVDGDGATLDNATEGTYTLTVTGENGCQATTTVEVVEVEPCPQAVITSSGDALAYCEDVNGTTLQAEDAGQGVEYVWTGPSGDRTTTVPELENAVAGNYTLTVTDGEGCEEISEEVTVTENPLPSGDPVLDVTETACAGTEVVASVSGYTDVDTYDWSIPSGSFVGADDGESITFEIGNEGGTISVTPVNQCGEGTPETAQIEVIDVPATPGEISGTEQFCDNQSNESYSIEAVEEATSYTWSVPGDADITDGDGTASVSVNFGVEDGDITVVAENECGTSEPASLATTNTGSVDAAISVSVDPVCEGETVIAEASVSGGGNSPEIQWYVDGVEEGAVTSEATLELPDAQDGQEVYAELVASSLDCAEGEFPIAAEAVVVDITPSPSAAEVGNTAISTCGTSVTMDAVSPEVGEGTWTLVSGDGNIEELNNPQTTISDLQEGESVFEWSVSNGECEGEPEQVTIERTGDLTTPEATASNSNMCVDNTGYSLLGNAPGDGEEGEWRVLSGDEFVSIGDPTDPQSSISGIAVGEATIGWFISSGDCEQDPATVDVEIIDVPASPGTVSGPEEVCANSEVTYMIDEVSGATAYNWTLPQGATVQGDANGASITVEFADNSGTVSVTAENGCGESSPSELPVEIGDGTPEVVIQSSESEICSGEEVVFSIASSANLGESPTFVWSLNGSPVEQGPEYSTSDLEGTDNTVILEATPSEDACVTDPYTSDPEVVDVIDDIEGEVSITGFTVCDGDDATIEANYTPQSLDPSFTWTVDGEVTNETGAEIVLPSMTASADVSVEMNFDRPCGDGTGSANDDATINVTSVPEVGLSAEANVICNDQSTLLTASGAETYEWFRGDASLDDVSGAEYEATEEGQYVVRGYVGENCFDESDTTFVSVLQLDVQAEALPPVIEEGMSSSLVVIAPQEGVTYLWSSGEAGTEITVSPLQTTDYVVSASYEDCRSTDTLEVRVERKVIVPNTFTPNNDGRNDVWEIRGIESYPSANVRVYNRWGSLVYESGSGYNKPFDGTRNGNELPTGTYYYLIDLGDDKEPLNGPLTIVK